MVKKAQDSIQTDAETQPETRDRDTTSSTGLLNKLLEVKKSVTYLQKAAKGAQYNYTSSSQVISAVREKMNDQGLLLTCAVNSSKVTAHEEGNEVKKRVTYFTELWMVFTWIDVATGEQLSLPWYGQGVDIAGEKGVGKAMTYAEKYFILKQFNIPTDKDDPDAFQEKNVTPENQAAARDEILKQLLANLASAKSLAEVTLIWTTHVDLQSNAEFKSAVTTAADKFRQKPVTDAGAATK